jgi:hypothetical protein
MRWDAAQGRYVNIAVPANKQNTDTLPQGVSPYSYGAVYQDAVTGEFKRIVAGNKPDTIVVKDSKTGAYVPKGSIPENQQAAPPVKPTPKTRTLTPKESQALGQGKMDSSLRPLPEVNENSVDNGWQNTPIGKTYVDTKTGETKERVAGNAPDIVVSAKQDGTAPTDQNTALIAEYMRQRYPEATDSEIDAKVAEVVLGGGGGNGGGGPSAAQKKASAKIQTQAGKKAQNQYNAMAAQFMKEAQDTTGKYYTDQQTQANKSIDAATIDYLNNIIKPQAYETAAIAQLTPEQQGLMSNLQAYGATGQQATQQRTEDTGYNQFMSQLMSGSAKQLGAADKGYFDALRNAGVGGQAAARQGVAQNVANLQGQSLANADAVRRQLIQAGIEALMAGRADAANTLAQ